MAKKGLPSQGSDAILRAMSDANAEMLKSGKKKPSAAKKTTKKSK